ncbi:MAG TPA: WYL domain-containing protein [Gammaproteobacteria bacterium]|nr:WYL domain-containing protein [Gammaproteobacteria bacterium]
MDRFDRITLLHRLLDGCRVPIPLEDIMAKLECSRATANRAIRTLRDDLGAPLEYDRDLNGYRYAGTAVYELPGLWLNPSELMALIASEHLLAEVEPGVLAPIIEPLRERLARLLERRQLGAGELLKRIRIFQTEARPVNTDGFRRIAEALGSRRQLHVLYHGRERDKTTERTVSPQRLVYYRDNWYLDAWCHESKGLRTFSLDRLHPIELLDESARECDAAELDAHFKSGYGIFAGPAKQTAVVRFTSEQARWVADELWHPDQQGKTLPDGGYELRVPYADPRELIMQIMKYGPDAETLEPVELRREVAERLKRMDELYAEFSDRLMD